MTIIVTGGAGFIGSAVCRHLVAQAGRQVVNFDKLTYAADLGTLASIEEDPRYRLVRGDIADRATVRRLIEECRPSAIMNLAAESHVDRSIDAADDFVRTNVQGTFVLLEEARRYWAALEGDEREAFRFLHISTDEVYGSLGPEGLFTETTAYDPSSPYSATKAASDHLVRAWGRTYGLPVLVTNCSNNYGPYQFPEKLIPLMCLRALHGQELPVYGTGENVRDWLFVEDHVEALVAVLRGGRVGETYNIGGGSERRNLEVVHGLCDLLDELAPPLPAGPRRELIRFVEDRPGHDARYAIDATKIREQLGWQARHDFAAGLRATVEWYLANEAWWRPLLEKTNALQRLGAARRQA
ncbi:MAG: dTDP-glucose 4,6-dehydratase [Tistlia sp.]|uniref:dTDP-glucose 4,6-dehydratase n=1 Tax=Tistlia sp. TaxID=3057121 RepID=UPI0034A5320B